MSPLRHILPLLALLLTCALAASVDARSQGLKEWVAGRRAVISQEWKAYVERVGTQVYGKKWTPSEISAYLDASPAPDIGLAASGGGYRALLNTAGTIKAMDMRSNQGGAGGVLQLANTLSGLSGGGWFTAAWSAANFPPIDELVESLRMSTNLGLSCFKKKDVFKNMLHEFQMRHKAKQRPKVAVPHWWGLCISSEILPSQAPDALSFSAIRRAPLFKSHQVPLPVVVAMEVTSDPSSSDFIVTDWEFSPFELDQLDPEKTKAGGAADITTAPEIDSIHRLIGIIGSAFELDYKYACVLIKSHIDDWRKSVTNVLLKPVVVLLSKAFARSNARCGIGKKLAKLVAAFQWASGKLLLPSSGFKHQPEWAATRVIVPDHLTSGGRDAYLVDSGLSKINIPIWPHFKRGSKIIFMIDSSANTKDGFPDGTDIAIAYERIGKRFPFPKVPASISVERNFIVFGCHEPNKASLVYIPNKRRTFKGEIGTSRFDYSSGDRHGVVENGYGALSSREDGLCVACFVLANGNPGSPQEKAMPQHAQEECRQCWSKYCWSN